VRIDPDITAILHAVGMQDRYNDEFVRAAIVAIATWRRWDVKVAAKWLKARAAAAQEAGHQVDKWWFVNALYRSDPREPEYREPEPMWDRNCRTCGGTGWRPVVTATAEGKVTRWVTRCDCWGKKIPAGHGAQREAATEGRGIPGHETPRRKHELDQEKVRKLSNALRM